MGSGAIRTAQSDAGVAEMPGDGEGPREAAVDEWGEAADGDEPGARGSAAGDGSVTAGTGEQRAGQGDDGELAGASSVRAGRQVARVSRICWPYFASLFSPTPLILPSSARVVGQSVAIWRRVASWKIT